MNHQTELVQSRDKSQPGLSIVMPTYNRANILMRSLEFHLPLLQEYNIKLYVFDNASTDNSGEIVKQYQQYYPLLEYHCNDNNIGPDNNFERALTYPDSKYIWLLGDTYEIPEDGIVYILDLINRDKGYPIIVFNLHNMIRLDAANTLEYFDYNALLSDLGGLMTCLSCLVYERNFIKQTNFNRYKNTNFLQTGIIFEGLPINSGTVSWVQNISIKGIESVEIDKVKWRNTPDALEIGCKQWVNFVFSLPAAYRLESKLKCLLDFGIISGIFSFRSIVNMRRLNIINSHSYIKYKTYFPLVVGFPRIIILILCFIPRAILKIFICFAILGFEKDKYNKLKRILWNKI